MKKNFIIIVLLLMLFCCVGILTACDQANQYSKSKIAGSGTVPTYTGMTVVSSRNPIGIYCLRSEEVLGIAINAFPGRCVIWAKRDGILASTGRDDLSLTSFTLQTR